MDPETIATLMAAVIGTSTAAVTGGWFSRLLKREVNEERTRLRTEVLGDQLVDWLSTSAGPADSTPQGKAESGRVTSEQRFAALLIEYYAYGLTQARRSFAVSLTCSVLGGLVLITGVALAVFRAGSDGPQYASIVASTAGLLTTAIGSLFHRRADLALKHMEAQTQSLRQDMKVERDAGQAIRLLDEVDDPALKTQLQAALILKFSAARLPEAVDALKDTDPSSARSPARGLPRQKPSAR